MTDYDPYRPQYVAARERLASELERGSFWNNHAADVCVLATAGRVWDFPLNYQMRATLRDTLGLTDSQCTALLSREQTLPDVLAYLRELSNN